MRSHLFLAGEGRLSMPLAFSLGWEHTTSAQPLVLTDGGFRRQNRPRERLRGAIYYCDSDDRDLERANLTLLQSFPVWPNPQTLLGLTCRHEAIRRLQSAGFRDCWMWQGVRAKAHEIDQFPCVLKTGNQHRGEQKYLLQSQDDVPEWDGLATAEPFWPGRSIRALIVGSEVFGIETKSDHWISNAPGCEVEVIDLPPNLATHARRVTDFLGLELAGIDYQVDDQQFHLLEANWAPGIPADPTLDLAAKTFLRQKMQAVEHQTG